MHFQLWLWQQQWKYLLWFPALSKVFKFADVEETGYVDVATISTLAVQLLGAQLSESEKETINNKAENKAEKGQISNFIFY